MNSSAQATSTSKPMLWTSRILMALLALFFLYDGGSKLLRARAAVDATMRVGYPDRMVIPIGAALLVSLVVYLIPRTSILGAILLTGYLGGATATMVRMNDPWFFFPVIFGMLVWLALYLRDEQLRAMIPIRR